MKLLAILTFIVTSSAFAQEYVSQKLTFSPRTHVMSSQLYYRCSFVEDQIERHLEKLGALNIRVRCTGGIVYGTTPMPANARITFDAPLAVENGIVETVVIKGRNSCDFNSEFLNKIIPMFPAAKLVSKRTHCNGSGLTPWNYKVELSK